jgi:nitrous oxide reductase accessory protein NosL
MKKDHMRDLIFPLLLLCVLFVLALPAWAGGPERCIVCGMDVSQYPHTRYVVKTTDEKTYVTCGVQCGLTLHLRFKDKWKSATASDLLSNRPYDATKGFYVYKSSVITDMAPGFIAFKRKASAEKFAKGFGGRVVTYPEALDIWKKRMQQ